MDVQLSDFVTIALLVGLEGLLSADNALVMAIMVLGLPARQHKKALHYGLLGAFIFRIFATLLAVYLIQVAWVKPLGGLYLLYLTYAHFTGEGEDGDRRTPPRATGMFGLSPLFATVIRVEAVNLAFSIDSILVAVAMSPKRWVVISGGILGIVAMRMVVGQLISLVQRYPALVDGAFVIIAWVGIKLGMEYLHDAHYVAFEIPRWLSLGLIVVIFTIAFIYAKMQGAAGPHRLAEKAEDLLGADEGDTRTHTGTGVEAK